MKMNMKNFSYSAVFIFAAAFGVASSAYAAKLGCIGWNSGGGYGCVYDAGKYVCHCDSGCGKGGKWECTN